MPSLEQIRKLEKTLSTNEAYINNLEKAISGRDEEISDQAEELELLRKNNSDLKRRLKKALEDIEHKEESLVILDSRISDLQQEITDLKNRIQDITSRKKNLAMAQAPNANEVQTLGETVRNAFNNINSILNRAPGVPRNIGSEFTDIRNAVNRLQEISNWETNRANRAQAQNNQDAQTIIRLKATARIADEELSLMTRVYHNEKQARRSVQSLYNKKHRRVVELLREKFATQLLLRNYSQRLQQSQNYGRALRQELDTCQDDLFLSDIQIDIKGGKWKNRTRNKEQIIMNLNQNILNFQQQILVLQNNPQNMATVVECSNIIAPSLANIPEFIGQEHPETWIERITKLFLHPTIAGNANFTDVHKVSVLSSKMAGPYHPVPAQNAYVNPAVNIDTPARFNAWLLSKYAEENVGGMTMGIQAILGEKFSPFDTPESYRDRIRKISIGVTDAIAVPILIQQLPPDLILSVRMYMNDRGAGNQTVANFFADLKRAYIEIRGGVGKPQVPTQVSNTQMPQNAPQIPASENKPPLPPGHEYRLDEFHMNQFLDDVAKKQDPNYRSYPGTEMGSPLPARFLNPIAERKFKLADRIRQSAYAEEKRLQDPENIDEYINDELASLYGQKMNLGGVRKNSPKRRSHKKKPVKAKGKGRKKRVGGFNTVDDSYYPENSSDNSEDDSEDDTEYEDEEETNYGLIGGVRKKK